MVAYALLMENAGMNLLFTCILLFTSSVWAFRPGEVFVESAQNLRPTQTSVGMIEVAKKKKKLEKFSTEERRQFLKARTVPVIVGPGNQLFVIDRHHLSRALLESGHRHLYVEVKTDWSQMSEAEFWKNMEDNGYAYLYDPNGKPILPSQLPSDLMELKDDPFRSLAYFARKAGAFAKSSIPFAEFKWAEYYKQFVTKKEIRKDFKKSLRKAVIASQSPQAAHLPGYLSTRNSCAHLYSASP
jgi:hypothetical protein